MYKQLEIHCVLKTVITTAFTLSTGYNALNGQQVCFSLFIDSCRTVDPGQQEIPVPKHAETLHATSERTTPAGDFVHGQPLYGKLQILDGGDVPECGTYQTSISKLEMTCIPDGEKLDVDTALWHLIYNANPLWAGPSVYDSSVQNTALGCKSRSDFQFTARRLSENSSCWVRSSWKFSPLGEEQVFLVPMKQHTLATTPTAGNSTSDNSQLTISCAEGTVWDKIKGDCIVTVTVTKQTKGLGVVACFILGVLAVLIYVIIACLDGDKKKVYYSLEETTYVHSRNKYHYNTKMKQH